MNQHQRIITVLAILACTFACSSPMGPVAVKTTTAYADLPPFFKEWREFQKPPMHDGVPDYSPEAMKKQHAALAQWQQRLHAFDTAGWPVKHQVDWYLVWAEMNGLDFDHRVIRPWANDPAFYVWFYASPSDVPEREGPNIHGAVDLPMYPQPWTAETVEKIAAGLRRAGTVFDQAKKNLTGNGKDLWRLGARSLRESADELKAFASKNATAFPDMAAAATEAANSTISFAGWVEEQSKTKNGTSGIGIADYNWCLKYVHLVPYTWHDEKILLERELARAHSGLRLAEFQNKKVPLLSRAATPEEYNRRQSEAIAEYIKFMESQEFMTVRPYMEPAMREQIFPFEPAEGLRGFFYEIDYRDPMPMRAHHFHWIDRAREREDPLESEIRRVPLLYNIFDTRAEGLATAMEEIVMQAGMLNNRPRVNELVYIMLAQRAARGLGGLYQHGLQMDFDQATKFASKHVPWGLLPAEGGTIQHEEHFYLQQPAYGECYVTGKLMIDKLIAEYARQREGKFDMKAFMDEFNAVGIIPMSLVYWQMTGDKSMVP